MKTFLALLFLAFASIAEAQSATDLTFAWNASPTAGVTEYRLYEQTGTSPNFVYAKVLTITSPTLTGQLTSVAPGTHTYVVRAYLPAGGESVNSNTVTTTVTAQPGAVVMSVTVIIR